MPIIYTNGDTPAFAVASGTGTACAQPDTVNSCLALADNVQGGVAETDATWNRWIATLSTHYTAGVIQYYEVWNEADSPNFFCYNGTACGGVGGPGTLNDPRTHSNVPSLKRLVRMAWDMKHILACTDASAKVISPSMHVNTVLSGDWFDNFNNTVISAPAGLSGVNGVPAGCNWAADASIYGRETYDFVNIHARGTASTNSHPEAIITAWQNLQTEYTSQLNAGNPLPNPTVFFNDEFGYNAGDTTSDDGRAAYIAREYALCAFLGFSNCTWYQWDMPTIGPSGTQQGTAYDTVAGWLIGSTVGTFTIPTVGTIYSEPLTSSGGISELMLWDSSLSASATCTSVATGCTAVTVANNFTTYTDLTGAVASITSHQVPVGAKPLLVK
jgi:hypothetical protein